MTTIQMVGRFKFRSYAWASTTSSRGERGSSWRRYPAPIRTRAGCRTSGRTARCGCGGTGLNNRPTSPASSRGVDVAGNRLNETVTNPADPLGGDHPQDHRERGPEPPAPDDLADRPASWRLRRSPAGWRGVGSFAAIVKRIVGVLLTDRTSSTRKRTSPGTRTETSLGSMYRAEGG